MSDLAREVPALRPQLLRFARYQLRNDDWAEDAVSETVLAALEKPQGFSGQSQLKTWLIGILKHKLVDQVRRRTREVSATTEDDDADLDTLLFHDNGHWRERPRNGATGACAARAPVLRRAGSLRRAPAGRAGPRVHDARVAGAGGRRDL